MKFKHLLLAVSLLPLFSFAQRSTCNNEIFKISYSAWAKKSFPVFSLGRSIRQQEFLLAIGGGKMGSDNQYISPDNLNSFREKQLVTDSKTIWLNPSPDFPKHYLERTSTHYRGIILKLGYAYYFNEGYCGDRLTGLYTGIDVSGIKIFEFQTLTYRSFKGDRTYEVSGENQFYTLGIALKAGYVWFPLCNEHFCLSGEIAHPFYIPFTQEINTSGPFTAGKWEVNAGIGWRINVR